jgi:hypothetical protein
VSLGLGASLGAGGGSAAGGTLGGGFSGVEGALAPPVVVVFSLFKVLGFSAEPLLSPDAELSFALP